MTTRGVAFHDVLTVQRPWGGFEQFLTNESASVKIITIEPGQRLSLQRHRHRDEMWRVLDGAVQVEVDGHEWAAQPGERVWVARGAVHRMGNIGRKSVMLLEVAFGHFDEDDIERLEDDYDRAVSTAQERLPGRHPNGSRPFAAEFLAPHELQA